MELFAAKAAGPLEHVKEEPQQGWVSGRHLLESRIDEETAVHGGFLHLTLRQAQRKVPPALLRAECRMAELTYQAEHDKQRLSRKEKRQIKQEVSERLLPQMPPQLSGIPLLVDHNDDRLYAGTASDAQMDLFLSHFRDTVGFEPVPLLPETAAEDLAEINPDSVPNLNFSPEMADEQACGTLGQNFLTWLWFYQEESGGTMPPSQLGEFSFMIDGPLAFVAEGAGALESNVRKGLPTLSAEAKAALTVGKKLKRAKLILSRERNEIWAANVDADTFAFRSLRLPEGEALDPGGMFEERVTNLYIFHTVFYKLFRKFLQEMSDETQVADFQQRAKEWVRNRDSR